MYMEQPKQPSLGQARGNDLCSNQDISQRSKEVPYSLSELSESIAVLQQELIELYGNLSPVIRNEPQPDSKPDCLGGSCDISRRINEMTLRVKVMSKDVIIVRNALEI